MRTIVSLTPTLSRAAGGGCPSTLPLPAPRERGCLQSIPIGVRLVRARAIDADVARLLVRELGERGAELRQLQPRDLLVEVFRKHVDADRIAVGLPDRVGP